VPACCGLWTAVWDQWRLQVVECSVAEAVCCLEMGQADGEGIAAGLSVWLYAAAGADQQARATATLSPSQR
jgi:hypothetical protein